MVKGKKFFPKNLDIFYTQHYHTMKEFSWISFFFCLLSLSLPFQILHYSQYLWWNGYSWTFTPLHFLFLLFSLNKLLSPFLFRFFSLKLIHFFLAKSMMKPDTLGATLSKPNKPLPLSLKPPCSSFIYLLS